MQHFISELGSPYVPVLLVLIGLFWYFVPVVVNLNRLLYIGVQFAAIFCDVIGLAAVWAVIYTGSATHSPLFALIPMFAVLSLASLCYVALKDLNSEVTTLCKNAGNVGKQKWHHGFIG